MDSLVMNCTSFSWYICTWTRGVNISVVIKTIPTLTLLPQPLNVLTILTLMHGMVSQASNVWISAIIGYYDCFEDCLRELLAVRADGKKIKTAEVRKFCLVLTPQCSAVDRF